MTVDFQKLQDEVSETRQDVQMLIKLFNQLNQSPQQPEETLLNVQQAADFLDVTTATIYDLVHNRRIPNHRPGKRLYFLRSELIEWVKNGRRMTTDELTQITASRPTRQTSKQRKSPNANA